MPMLSRNTKGSTTDSMVSDMARRDSSTASPTYTGSSRSTRSLVSLMTTENPARKHFSLHSFRTASMACIVSSAAPDFSYWMIIMVESPAKNISRREAGIRSAGISIPRHC